jgi:hypothetical protein
VIDKVQKQDRALADREAAARIIGTGAAAARKQLKAREDAAAAAAAREAEVEGDGSHGPGVGSSDRFRLPVMKTMQQKLLQRIATETGRRARAMHSFLTRGTVRTVLAVQPGRRMRCSYQRPLDCSQTTQHSSSSLLVCRGVHALSAALEFSCSFLSVLS